MTFIEQVKEHKVRFLQTLVLYLAFAGNGLSSGIVGPTLLDLQIAASSTFDEVTWVIPARSGGYALGSVIGEYMWMLQQVF